MEENVEESGGKFIDALPIVYIKEKEELGHAAYTVLHNKTYPLISTA